MSLSEKHQTLREQTDDALFDFFENTKHVLCSDKTRSEIVDVCLQKFREWLEQKRKDFLVESVFGMGEDTEKGLEIFDKLIKELE